MADADLSLRDDVEKVAYSPEKYSGETSSAPRHDSDAQIRRGNMTPHHDSFFSAFTLQSFKRNPNARVITEATDLEGRPLAHQPPAEPALAMKLKPRHLQMTAIGGSIGMLSSRNHLIYASWTEGFLGTGLFVGSGSALATGGPASLIIAYGLISIMLFYTVHALGELAVAFPIAGAFSVYSSRFIDPA